MVPKRGIDPNDGDPTNHVLVKSPEEHMRVNPEDFERLRAEGPPSPTSIQEHVKNALAEVQLEYEQDVVNAIAEERERCAKIAEKTGGKYGKAIAEEIRGKADQPTIVEELELTAG